MLGQTGFDQWANDYDKCVGLSDEDDTYPFAGYRRVLNRICDLVSTAPGKSVLDIGFGTGTLAATLYARGYTIWGQDFSANMVALAQKKMPRAKLYQGDFSQGLAAELKQQLYDIIVATYSLHHLTDARKIVFLRELLPLLNKGGAIYIGDVAFKSRAELEKCRVQAGETWDEAEHYFVFDTLRAAFPSLQFEPISACAGLLILRR